MRIIDGARIITKNLENNINISSIWSYCLVTYIIPQLMYE
jgi:hypothetical protein